MIFYFHENCPSLFYVPLVYYTFSVYLNVVLSMFLLFVLLLFGISFFKNCVLL